MTRQGMLSVISSIHDSLRLTYPFPLQGRRVLQGLCQVVHGLDEIVSGITCQKLEASKAV